MVKIAARTQVRTLLLLGIVAIGAALSACRGKSKSNDAAAPLLSTVAPDAASPPADTATPPPPISVPADVTGSYLTCEQTDEPAAAAAPSQPDRIGGEQDVAFGCAVVGKDGKKVGGHIDALTVDAAVKGSAARYAIKSVVTDAQSRWHVVFKLPLHVAQVVTRLDGVVVVDGKITPLAQKASGDTVDPSPLQYIATIARNEGPLAGGRLVVIRGRGLTGATAVKLGDNACLQTMPSTDHFVVCKTAAVSASATGLTVTVSTTAGDAKLPNGYSYLAQTKVACDQTLGQPTTVVESGTQGAPFLICNREQLLDALAQASGHFLKLVDNIDLYRGGNIPATPSATGVTLDGSGFAVIGLSSVATDAGANAGLFTTLVQSDVQNLGFIDATISSKDSSAGALAALPTESSFARLYAARCKVTGYTTAGGLLGWGVDNGLESVTAEAIEVGGTGSVGGVAGFWVMNRTLPFHDIDVAMRLFQCDTSTCGGVTGSLQAAGGVAQRLERIRVTMDVVAKTVVDIGGLFGSARLSDTQLDDLEVRITTAPLTTVSRAGGLAANANFLDPMSQITNARFSGHIAGAPVTTTLAGGIVGYLTDGSLELKGVTSTVNIDGVATIGGAIGKIVFNSSALAIRDVLVSGELHSTDVAGGLVGVASVAIEIDHALVLAHVTSDLNFAGALIGSSSAPSNLSAVYWNSETIGATLPNMSGTDVGGKTTKELQEAATYGGTWKDSWTILDDHYPVLRVP